MLLALLFQLHIHASTHQQITGAIVAVAFNLLMHSIFSLLLLVLK